MLNIGICVKDNKFEKYIISLLKGMLREQDEYNFVSISVKSLVDRDSGMFVGYPAFIIDEQLLREEGTGTVEYLSRVRPDAEIILVEGEKELNAAGLRYHVFAYRMKRLKQRDLTFLLSEKIKMMSEPPSCLLIKIDGEELTILIRQILYVESRNRHVILHTLVGDYEYGEKMYVLEELLSSEGFVRCHRSFIVSKRYITDINSQGIWIEHECIPVGRAYTAAVRQEFSCDDNGNNEKDRSYKAVQKNVFEQPQIAGNMIRACENIEKKTEKQGLLIGMQGLYKGVKFHFHPEEKIMVGRSETSADIVLNLPLISRLHCVIVFHEKENSYEVVDFSKNGTYINDGKRIAPDTSYILKPGTAICFGDTDNVYRLG